MIGIFKLSISSESLSFLFFLFFLFADFYEGILYHSHSCHIPTPLSWKLSFMMTNALCYLSHIETYLSLHQGLLDSEDFFLRLSHHSFLSLSQNLFKTFSLRFFSNNYQISILPFARISSKWPNVCR